MPPSAQVFVARPAYRPPGSYRCFYVNPSWHEGTFPDDGVMAVKGMEPATHDFEVVLQGLQRPCYTPHNIAEHLVFEERKLPGSLALPEALREAKAAASLQAAHWHAYGHLARVPLPLAVF